MPTFDGENLVITLDSGITEVDAEVDLYSEWKAWTLLSDNAKYPPAFRSIGGDPLTPTLNAGSYFFLQNQYGWRLRPPEEDIQISLIGNLVGEDSTLPLFVPTIGAYTATVIGVQPVTQGTGDVAGAVWDKPIASHIVSGSFGLKTQETIYAAKVLLFDDNANLADHYVVSWFANNAVLSSGITSPTIQVVKVSDGTDLIAEAAMTQIGAIGRYKYDASGSERITSGAAYLVIVKATIDGSVRTWDQPIGRDS
jgi:hypothetical protein